MIHPSPELLAVSRRWYQAVISRESGTLENFLSLGPELRFVGSAKGESWSGQAVRRAIGAHFREVPRVLSLRETEAEAFEQGEIGWSCFAHEFLFETRKDPVNFRTTLIFALENGSWKIVHRHASVPTPNIELLGHEHTAIRKLVEAVQQGFSLDQREGLASVMFTDIVGSSTLASATGDRRWSRLMGEHFAQLREIIEQHEGQFVKSLGDGAMSSFASAHQALAAAQAIQVMLAARTEEPRLALRIGLHTGDVVQSEDDFFGNVVNIAARITSTADPGEIWASDATRLMIGTAPGFSFAESREVLLRGQDEKHLIHKLHWSD